MKRTIKHNGKYAFERSSEHLPFCKIKFSDKMQAEIPQDVLASFPDRFCKRNNSFEYASNEEESNILSAYNALKSASGARRKEGIESAIEILEQW